MCSCRFPEATTSRPQIWDNSTLPGSEQTQSKVDFPSYVVDLSLAWTSVSSSIHGYHGKCLLLEGSRHQTVSSKPRIDSYQQTTTKPG
jgi:hypothetical protein